MDDRSKDYSCSSRCEEHFKACLRSKEHESVCRMKKVQCDSTCVVY